MTQGSIEWLASQIMDNWNDITAGARDIAEFIDKAKAMHKEEMCEFAVKCMDGIEYGLLQSEVKTYYNETLNTKEK